MGHEKNESDSFSKDLFSVYYYKYKFLLQMEMLLQKLSIKLLTKTQ